MKMKITLQSCEKFTLHRNMSIQWFFLANVKNWQSQQTSRFILVFFQNEEVFVQLDELDELDRITHAWIWLNCCPTQAQKTF